MRNQALHTHLLRGLPARGLRGRAVRWSVRFINRKMATSDSRYRLQLRGRGPRKDVIYPPQVMMRDGEPVTVQYGPDRSHIRLSHALTFSVYLHDRRRRKW